MFASQANKWLCPAVAALLTIAGICQAHLSPKEEAFIMSDKYQDDMTGAIKILWASKEEKPAGFERTQNALVTILNELNAPDVRDSQMPKELLEAKRLASIYLNACELSRTTCVLWKDRLAGIKREHVLEDSINQLPYLEVCERAHERFCKQLGSREGAKKQVWHELKKEVAREEAEREPKNETAKKSIWPKSWPKHIVF